MLKDGSGLGKRIFPCLAIGVLIANPTRLFAVEGEQQYGKRLHANVTMITGSDLTPHQTSFKVPELADPYVTFTKRSLLVSGTAQYYLKFASLQSLRIGGPYQVVWNDYYYADGTPMEGNRHSAQSWDMKPVLWSTSSKDGLRLWDASRDTKPPLVVWYGGHMRPQGSNKVSHWPEDNYSRDIFAFVEKEPGKWFSQTDSIFSGRRDWPRQRGNFLGHRYGHQIVMIPKVGPRKKLIQVPAVFYEEVTKVREDGSPLVTKIFMDEMVSPYQVRGAPTELVSPVNSSTGKFYPSATREDGSGLVEGPLYFRFDVAGEQWEAIGFSAGSFYGDYPACFAARKVSDGLKGKPYRVDLKPDEKDFHNAGESLGKLLRLAGGPARPAVIVKSDGRAVLSPRGELQLLVHAYRQDILPDHDFKKPPSKYRLDQMFRVTLYANLKVRKSHDDSLRFQIVTPLANLSPQ